MTDVQFGALITSLLGIAGTIAGTIKWAVGRLTKALDDNTESNRELSKAQIESAKASAVAATKLDAISNWVHHHTPVEMQAIDPYDPYTVERPPSERQIRDRIKTAPHGYRPPRPGGNDD